MLILRTVKGSKLTWSELDGNFTYLEDEIEVVRELADGDTLVRITPQVFLPEQRDQALANIGAAPQSVINDIEARVEFLETIQPVTYDLQTPTPEMQQQLRDNAGVFSKDEVTQSVQGVDNTLLIDEETASLVLKRAFNDEIVSAIPLSSLAAQPKQKVLFTHVITEEDLAGEENISLQLDSSPDLLEWYDLHINGGFVNDNSYHIEENKLIIHRHEIAYPITASKKVTFRYRTQ